MAGERPYRRVLPSLQCVCEVERMFWGTISAGPVFVRASRARYRQSTTCLGTSYPAAG